MLNNRWIYTSIQEKKQFSFTVFIISSVVLLEFILLDIIGEIVRHVIGLYFSPRLNDEMINNEEFNMFLNNAASIMVLWISFSIASAILILFLRRFKSKADYNINNRVSFRFRMPENSLMLLFLGLAVMYLSGSVSMLFDFLLDSFGIEKFIVESSPFPKTDTGIILYFVALVVSPAILEEIFCRYLILNALRKYGDGFAITVSAVFFGLLHGRTTAFFYATAIGFFLGYFAVKTKSIWFPVILHAFVNFMAFFWHFISDLVSAEQLFNLVSFSFWTVLFAVSVIYIIIIIRKKKDLSLTRRRDYIHINRGRKTFVFFNAATIIFIILAFMQSALEYR